MDIQIVAGKGAAAAGLARRAAEALALPSSLQVSLRAEAMAAFASASRTGGKMTGETCSVTFDASGVVGAPLVIPIATEPDEGDRPPAPPGPFVPLFMDEKVIAVPLAGAAAPTQRATALVVLDAHARPTVAAVYAGEPVERLDEPGFGLALPEDSAIVSAVIGDFAEELARRLRSLHEAAECLGLPASRPGLPFGGVGLSGKTFALTLKDGRDGREVRIEVIRNGSLFADRRRYTPRVTKLGFSDAEIVRSSIVSIDIDRPGQGAEVTFMTWDGRPSRLVVDADRAAEPLIDRIIPPPAIDAMRQRPEEASLGASVHRAIAEIRKQGALRSFFARLWSARARRDHEDMKILLAYTLSDPGIAGEAKKWAEQPDRMREAGEAALRHLPAGDEHGESPMRRALLAIGVGRLLAEAGETKP